MFNKLGFTEWRRANLTGIKSLSVVFEEYERYLGVYKGKHMPRPSPEPVILAIVKKQDRLNISNYM